MGKKNFMGFFSEKPKIKFLEKIGEKVSHYNRGFFISGNYYGLTGNFPDGVLSNLYRGIKECNIWEK